MRIPHRVGGEYNGSTGEAGPGGWVGVEELACGRTPFRRVSIYTDTQTTNGEVEHEQRTDQHLPLLGQILIWTQNQQETVMT